MDQRREKHHAFNMGATSQPLGLEETARSSNVSDLDSLSASLQRENPSESCGTSAGGARLYAELGPETPRPRITGRLVENIAHVVPPRFTENFESSKFRYIRGDLYKFSCRYRH